jgi:hypothetical protein
MKPIRETLLVSTLLIALSLAWAHDDTTLDAMKSPNGGQVRMAGAYHFELLIPPAGEAAAGTTLLVFVTDHAGAKVPTNSAAGSATLLIAGKKTTIPLAPAGENRMRGQGSFPAAADMKVLVSIKLSERSPELARFTPRIGAGIGAQRISQ